MKLSKLIIGLTFVIFLKSLSCVAADKRGGFAVVELFTSEGCSSCPAAEETLSKINKKYENSVYVMEFHVDYWNNLGWKDPFSNESYTTRQQQYAQKLELSSTYTPQAVVNGKTEMVGSAENRLKNEIDRDLNAQAGNSIQLIASEHNGEIEIHYVTPETSGQTLNFALIQKSAEINVKRGENSGKRLKHTNVVRAFKTVSDVQKTGGNKFSLPAGLNAMDCFVIAFLQDQGTWAITGAATCEIN